jgi:hypothetical protein
MLKNEFSIDQQEDEDLRCPICNYYFSEITKPYLLPCNHNLCLKCIDCIIDKKYFGCPICRKNFKEEDKKKFQVNFAFLNLVIKILKTKVIFCKKCSKIYNWVDHYSLCDQRDFMETNEMFEQIKKLADESYLILKTLDRHINVLPRSKMSIFEATHDILKIIKLKFFENFHKTIEQFFTNIPVMSYKSYIRDLKRFLELCRPLNSKLNLEIDHIYDIDEDAKSINSDRSENCFNSDDDYHKKRTKSQNRNRDGYINFHLRETPNVNQSLTRLPSHQAKKNKSLNNSAYLEEEITKNKIKSMLSSNFRSVKEVNCDQYTPPPRKIPNLNSNILYNPIRKFSETNNFKLRGFSNKSLPIKEEDEEERDIEKESDYFINHNRFIVKNRKKDIEGDLFERDTIKLNCQELGFENINLFKKSKLRALNSSEEKEYNSENEIPDTSDVNDDFNYRNPSLEDNVNYGSNSEANFHIEINENFSGGVNTIINKTNTINNSFNKNYSNNYNKNIEKEMTNMNDNASKNKKYTNIKSNPTSTPSPIINVPKQIDTKLFIKSNTLKFNHDDPFSRSNKNPMINDNVFDFNNQPGSTSIMNYNYNFNLNQIFKSSYTEENEKNKNSTKKKIIVKNNEVRIVNLNTDISDSKKDSYNQDKSFKNTSVTEKKFIDVSRSTENKTYTEKSKKNLDKIKSRSKQINKPNKISTPQNPQDIINNLLEEFNKTREIVDKILNYTNQVELTSGTILNQISNNFNHLQDNITRNINSLCDNITVDYSQSNRQYLINYVENTKKIWIFDVKKMKSEQKEYEFLKFKFNSSMSIDYDDNDLIFVSGGKVFNSSLFESDFTFTNNFLVLNWSNRTVELSGQMPRKRAFHSSIFFNGKYYILGGLTITVATNPINTQTNQVANIRECECYNWLEKRWELLPNLNSGRCNPSLCVYNGTYLYAFRGWINSSSQECHFLDTIEFININNITTGWTMFKPEDPGMCWISCSNSSATVIGENKILICGGISNCCNINICIDSSSTTHLENKFLNYSYIFDPTRKSVFRSNDLLKASSFNSAGTVHEKSMIIIDNKNEISKPFGIHLYDMEKNMWKFNHI